MDAFKHQQIELDLYGDEPNRGLLWGTGTGKTKGVLDKIGRAYAQGRIDAVLAVSPKNAVANFLAECRKHLVAEGYRGEAYHTNRAKTKKQQALLSALAEHGRLAILSMSYDSLSTDAGLKAALAFLRKRRVAVILDEAHRIKSSPRTTRRTRHAMKLSRFAEERSILSGTLSDESPFDVYEPVNWLDEDFWERELGIRTRTAFRRRFGVFNRGYNKKQGREFDQLVGYKNLEQLRDALRKITTRVTKESAGLNLPPKLYSQAVFEMTREQRKIYEALRDHYLVELDDGREMTAGMALTRLLRLQQIANGYMVPDQEPDEEIKPDPIPIPGKNPRLEMLKDLVEDTPDRCIIWAVYRHDFEQIMSVLPAGSFVTFYGATSDEDRWAAEATFQGRWTPTLIALRDGISEDEAIRLYGEDGIVVPEDERPQFFVANPQCASEALTLTAATRVIYYSSSFKLTQRKQSEDRCHRIGQHNPVSYVDLVAAGTVDEYIIDRLVKKHDISALVMGDERTTWLERS